MRKVYIYIENDNKLMDVVDMWIIDKTDWLCVDMSGRDASNN